jgi:DNA-binding transcriptional regulator GbsR (MarR family)
MDKKLRIFSKDTLDFANSIGRFIEYWGFRRIHGEVWALIYLSEGPLTTAEIIKNLDVSKGLVSTTLKTLVDYGLIYHVESDNKKEKMFEACEKITPIICNVLLNREAKLLKTIKDNFNTIKKSSDGLSAKRIKNLERYINLGSTLLNAIIKFSSFDLKRWRNS